MKLKIKEYLMTSLFDLTNDFRPFSIEKLHTDLYKRLSTLKLI